jgi:opacity protein-like surface antigen
MKKSLLATVAAVAVIAGPALAQKQEAPPSRTEAPSPAPSTMQKAPAEKVAPAAPKADRSSTTGQATPSTKGEIKAGSDTKSGADVKSGSDTRTPSRTGADSKSGTDTKTQAGTDTKAGAGGSVSLSAEQKTKIRSSVLTSNAPRVTNVNFSIRVGTVVPRTVRLVAVPAPLIEIHPAWRGKMYFVYNDQIIIVEPDTHEIITIVVV